MRVLTDPAETGAVTLCLPQDVQAEAYEWPEELFDRRVWRVRRPVPEPAVLAEAAELLRGARTPLIVSGGGTIYSEATEALAAFAEATGIPVAETQAGKGSLRYDHPQAAGAIGATGTTDANALAREADVVLGVGTRWSDFTTASRSIFANEDVRFINLNVAPIDSIKHSGLPLLADARRRPRGAHRGARGHDAARRPRSRWDAVVERAYTLGHTPLPAQSEVIGVVNRVSGPRDVVVCAAGSMPGDLHKLWRTRDPKGYHVDYGYSTMGYEIAGGLGVKMAAPDREVFVLVGDGSYLMMAQELVTAVAEGIKLTVVLVQNHGYASIGALERVGRLAALRHASTATVERTRSCRSTWPRTPPASAPARSYSSTIEEFESALREAVASDRTTVVQIETDPLVPAPGLRGVVGRAGGGGRRAGVHPRRPRRPTSATRRPRRPYLKTPETVRTLREHRPARNHRPPIGGARDRRRLDPHRPRLRPRDRARAAPRAAGRAGRTSMPRCRPPRRRSRRWSDVVGHAPRAGDVRLPRADRASTPTSSRGSSPPSTARPSTTPRARSSAGWRSSSSRAGSPS